MVVRALEPFVTEARLTRLRGVVRGRLGSVVVVLDSIRDPYNAAAVLRSCDAFGIQEVHVIEAPDRFRPARAVTTGAHKWLDVTRHVGDEAAVQCVRALKRRGYRVLAASMQGELVEKDLAAMPRVAVVMGNEKRGPGDAVRGEVDATFRVRMRGLVESFNVSVATAVSLFAATSERAGDLDEATRALLYARLLLDSVRGGEHIVQRFLADTRAWPREHGR